MKASSCRMISMLSFPRGFVRYVKQIFRFHIFILHIHNLLDAAPHRLGADHLWIRVVATFHWPSTDLHLDRVPLSSWDDGAPHLLEPKPLSKRPVAVKLIPAPLTLNLSSPFDFHRRINSQLSARFPCRLFKGDVDVQWRLTSVSSESTHYIRNVWGMALCVWLIAWVARYDGPCYLVHGSNQGRHIIHEMDAAIVWRNGCAAQVPWRLQWIGNYVKASITAHCSIQGIPAIFGSPQFSLHCVRFVKGRAKSEDIYCHCSNEVLDVLDESLYWESSVPVMGPQFSTYFRFFVFITSCSSWTWSCLASLAIQIPESISRKQLTYPSNLSFHKSN